MKTTDRERELQEGVKLLKDLQTLHIVVAVVLGVLLVVFTIGLLL